MKSFSMKINHPEHGEMSVHGTMHPAGGTEITHYGHGGETVPAADAHGSHEGGVNEHMQGQIKAHASKLGAGDHHMNPSIPALKLEKCEGDMGMEKAEAAYSPLEAAIKIMKKMEELVTKAEEKKDTNDKSVPDTDDGKIEQLHDEDCIDGEKKDDKKDMDKADKLKKFMARKK
jgi:hypothetical protein